MSNLLLIRALALLPLGAGFLHRQAPAVMIADPQETCTPLENHESYSSVKVRIGTPAQSLNLIADTGSNNVIVTSCTCQKTQSCPKDFGACFEGENVSSTFVLPNVTVKNQSHQEDGPQSLLIAFGSGPIGAYVASDVVHVGAVRTFLENSLLLMVKQQLSVKGPFEGILGLGQPSEEGEAVPGFLEKAGVQRFSMCFNYEGDGVLGLNSRSVQSPWLRSVGRVHWGLDFRGASVGPGAVSFCSPQQKKPGQQTACAMIPDSGTTLINGPREQVLLLFEDICRNWKRCRDAQSALEEELADLGASNLSLSTRSSLALLQGNLRGGQQEGKEGSADLKALADRVVKILTGAAPEMQNMTDLPAAPAAAPGPKRAPGVHMSDTFQLLLQHCADWIDQVNVDDELPELVFHVGGSGDGSTELTLRPAAYVLQAKMTVATPHVQNVLGFLPLEVFRSKSEQVCMPAFSAQDYHTEMNGDVWIMGTPLFYEYTVHYDRAGKVPSMAFEYAGDTACGVCKGDRIVRDGPSLLSEGAGKPDGLSSLRRLTWAPVARNLTAGHVSI